jgi:methylase of polypeptide subunit release factors
MTSTTTEGLAMPVLQWTENEQACSARWRSENGIAPPKRVVVADDTLTADSAYRLACEGTGILWRGDFQNARQLLQALARRVDRPSKKSHRVSNKPAPSTKEAFHLHRLTQSQRSRTLGMLLIPFDADYSVPLRRAPDVKLACNEAYGQGEMPFVASLRELLGVISAHEWRKRGIEIPALEDAEGAQRIHPHYGVFAPVRTDYVPLVAQAPLPALLSSQSLAFDIGTGTGVLAAILAKRGIARIVATDQDARALSCARENMKRLDIDVKVEVIEADLFPGGQAALVLCNPPWLPARPSSPLEHAVFDPESRMLQGFLNGLAAHLLPGGEGWLILSDFAEHLGLRTRAELLQMIEVAGLKVVARIDAKPGHPKVADENDALHAARAAEVTSLWRLAAVKVSS